MPGVVERTDAHGETTLVAEPTGLIEACTYLRDELGFDFLADITSVDYLGWGGAKVAGYIGTAAGRSINDPMTQGLQRLPEPKPKRFAMNYHLLAVRRGAPRVRVQVWLDDGEASPLIPSGPPPTGTSARRSTCSASRSRTIRISRGS